MIAARFKELLTGQFVPADLRRPVTQTESGVHASIHESDKAEPMNRTRSWRVLIVAGPRPRCVGLRRELVVVERRDDTRATTTTEGGVRIGGARGEVGPGFDIEVKQNGEDAESVKAGTYTLKVEDKSDIHNFHLIGPGVDEEVT